MSEPPKRSTHLSLHAHLVFSTKHRTPWITGDRLPALHAYLGGTLRGLKAIPQAVGGVADHVHLLIGFNATHVLSDLVRETKKASNTWFRETYGERKFTWQEGYAAFTVSPDARDTVKAYLARQEAHHRVKSFREEVMEMFRRAGMRPEADWLD